MQPRQILDLNAFQPATTAVRDPAVQALIERRIANLGPVSVLFYDEPLHIVRGEGVWLVAADGRRYLDVYNNVPSVGHCHPRVVDAIARQAAVLNVHNRYLSEITELYVERLKALLPPSLSQHRAHLQRQRGQRSGASPGAPRDRQHWGHRHVGRLSRQHRSRDRDLALGLQARPAAGACPGHSTTRLGTLRRRYRDRVRSSGRGGRGFARRGGIWRCRPGVRLDLLERRGLRRAARVSGAGGGGGQTCRRALHRG